MYTSPLARFLWLFLTLISTICIHSYAVSAQAYVVELSGVWKTQRGVVIKEGKRVPAATRLTSASRNREDAVTLVDPDGKVVGKADCTNGCTTLEVPNTGTWSGFVYCLIIKCSSPKYTTSGVKGDECLNPDAIAEVDANGVTNLLPVLSLYSRTTVTRDLTFHRTVGGNVEQLRYEVSEGNPKITGLQAAVYDVRDGDSISRLLVLPTPVYQNWQKSFIDLKRRVDEWRRAGLSNCTIKKFTQAYIDHVEKETKKESRDASPKGKRTD